VIKLDNEGNKIWDKYIEMVGKEGEDSFFSGDFDKRLSLVQTHDSGYAIVGYSLFHGSFFVKLDNKGEIIWRKFFKAYAYSLVQTHDRGYIIAGHTTSKGARLNDIWIIKLDNKGNKIWDRTFGENGYDEAYSIIQTTDGSYAVAGGIHRNYTDYWIIKLYRKQILE